ncbi:2TM domain-containing protein [Tenacibaculum sp. AHE15PA]|uniref:2TM domain-containing protein n=1 Tax=Tenacibaculum TaxID=104267 RepID=UPI001C4E78B7|nr:MULTISPECIES: 2TM domain-containing protein [Tenacibaculum]QXP74077.1 2TM domain-containing protein [Tenacibaculum sp. AHE14PA]QXP75555.1 2TM domain-containing protein [Tenacibaculum sp. AHE15PA]
MEDKYIAEQKYTQAKKRVKKIKGFYTHLAIYCIIIPVIIFVNLKFEPHFHWFWFSALGWGTGLFCHWLNVFGFNKTGLTKNWEERKIKELMNEDKNYK